MSTTAATTKHIRTIWRGEKAWHWAALYRGHVQPRGYRTYLRPRRLWQFHITPVHLSRYGDKWEIGVCWGRRTLYVLRHK